MARCPLQRRKRTGYTESSLCRSRSNETRESACERRDGAKGPDARVAAGRWELEISGVHLLLEADEVDHQISRERGRHCQRARRKRAV